MTAEFRQDKELNFDKKREKALLSPVFYQSLQTFAAYCFLAFISTQLMNVVVFLPL